MNDKITLESQILLLDEIRKIILSKPEKFDMSRWHSDCGTSHCLAGWVQKLRGGDNAKEEGDKNLPDFNKFFYLPTDKVREWLNVRAYALKEGEFIESKFGFMSNRLNTYSKLDEAIKLDITNKDCIGCKDCNGCKDSIRCEDCIRCEGCEDCIGLEGAKQ